MRGIPRYAMAVLLGVSTVAVAEAQVARQPVVLPQTPARLGTLTGTWYVFMESPHLHLTAATLSMVQTGASVTGVLAAQNGGSGPIVGTVTDLDLTFSLTSLAPCAGSATGVLNIRADYRSAFGELRGTDCRGDLIASLHAANLTASGGTNVSPDVTGSWDVTLTSNIAVSAVFTMVQHGAAVTGSGALPGGTASVQGIVGDLLGTQTSSVWLTVYGVGACPGTFNALLTVSDDGQTFSGDLGGTDCQGLYSAGVSARRRSPPSEP